MRFSFLVCWALLIGTSGMELTGINSTTIAQDLKIPKINEFVPKSKLKVKRTTLAHAKFPVVDVHTHPKFKLKRDPELLEAYVEAMDRQNIAISISLDSKLGNEDEHLDYLKPHAPRFLSFAHIDFIGSGSRKKPKTWACNQPGFVRLTCEQLKVAKTKGIRGLKFFKSFGLEVKKANGDLYGIDDPLWFPIWETCGELGLPIIIHTADPSAFFDPIGPENERFEELLRHPNWSFHGDKFPSRESLLEARNNVIRKFGNTKFIGAHVANSSEDLAVTGKWLDELPNLTVGIASRISELGRQPFTAKAFLEKYQDRVLFGTDGPWSEVRLRYYWRFLETNDEYFPYSEKKPQPQGLWNIYGVALSDEVLQKIYFRNAFNVISGLQVAYEKVKQDDPFKLLPDKLPKTEAKPELP